jgi:ribosomal protein S18 acetylase RimI-like enzyme
MQKLSQELSDSAAIASIYDNLDEYYRFLGRSPVVELYNSAEVSWIITGVRDHFLNGIFRSRFARGPAERRIAEILAYFIRRSIPFMWITEPAAKPSDLGTRLERHGLTYSADWLGMTMDVSEVREEERANLTIDDVQDRDTLEKWVGIYTESFKLGACRDRYFAIESGLALSPEAPRRHLIGAQQGRPVAAATLFLGAGVAGIYNVATVPKVRRRGFGTAMVSACLHQARAAGYRTAVLHASPIGTSLYRRLGFKRCCVLNGYIWARRP